MYDNIEKEVKQINKDIENQYLEQKKQEIIELYNKEFKTKLEKAVLLNDDPSLPVINITIETDIAVKTFLDKHKIIANVLILPKTRTRVEEEILIASWHGTTFGINKEIKKFIIDTAVTENIDIEKLDTYYFPASNADILFTNQIEILLQKKE